MLMYIKILKIPLSMAASPPSAASHTLSHHHNSISNSQRSFVTLKKIDIKTTISRNLSKMKCHVGVKRNTVISKLAHESGERKKLDRVRVNSNVDTRIHWENEDEGWVGGDKRDRSQQELEEDENDLIARKFSDLINNSSDSHYQFLGVSPTADLEEIKSAYRRLSKEYHPDTTTLPLKSASNMFMKLRDIYDVLSDTEKRKFYDWTLAQEEASREVEKMRVKLEDPFIKDFEAYVPVPDMVDRLGGKNMKLSDQAVSALTFDILVIIFSICCIIYVAYFKET